MQWRQLLRDYVRGLASTPQLVHRLAFSPMTLEDERQEALLRGNLTKAFSGPGLLLMALGFVIGSGAYGSNGAQAAEVAGCVCAAVVQASLPAAHTAPAAPPPATA